MSRQHPKACVSCGKKGLLGGKGFRERRLLAGSTGEGGRGKKTKGRPAPPPTTSYNLNHKGLARANKRKKEEKEEKEEKMAGKKAKAEAKALYKKQVDDAFHALTRDANTGGIVLPKKKWQEEGECGNCFAWWGAWQERGLLDDGFRWKACDFCDT